MPGISSSRDAYDILFYHWDQAKLDFIEQFKVILLSRANKVLGIFEAATGSSTAVLVDPKLIMAAAIKSIASSIILAPFCYRNASAYNKLLFYIPKLGNALKFSFSPLTST